MAHPSRKEWAEDLAKQLDCPIYWDTDNVIWNTCKGAWTLAPNDSDYHFVIQDDAILCRDFKDKVNGFVEDSLAKHGETAFQLYFGGGRYLKQRKKREEAIELGYYKQRKSAWGVAIGMPTRLIPEMVLFGDSHYAWQDDTKIKYFLMSQHLHTVFPIPCLVNHRPPEEVSTLTPCVDYDKSSPIFIDDLIIPKIPKIIHQIWIGDKSKQPKELMNTWKMEGWEYKLWTEKEIDELQLENKRLYDYFYDKKCYYGASDVVRLEILKRFGGIYIDADTERLEPIDEIMEGCTFWSVWSNTEGRIANGVIATIPEHPIVVNYLKEMGEARVVEPVWSTIGGTLFTKMIFEHQDKHTKLMPPRTFYPFDSKGVKNTARHKIYAQHYWGSTHRSYGKL